MSFGENRIPGRTERGNGDTSIDISYLGLPSAAGDHDLKHVLKVEWILEPAAGTAQIDWANSDYQTLELKGTGDWEILISTRDHHGITEEL
jgi:hypothetical protein